MDGNIDVFTLLSLIVAVVAILKLRSVLGRRTGDEDARIEQRRQELETRKNAGAAGSSDKVVSLPRRDRDAPPQEAATAVSVAETEARIQNFANGDKGIESGLLEVLKLDRTFDPDHFVRGAKAAYEMIVTAFAEGNRNILRDLLSREVFDGFKAAIADREQRGEQIDQSFVGINKADILEAEVKNGVAHITVRFVSQLITATRNKVGEVIAGDASKVKDVTDIWTFSRDIATKNARKNLNWKLVGTQAPN